MHIYSNHCFSGDSIWGGPYSARYMVTIEEFPDNSQEESEEWKSILEEVEFVDYKKLEKMKLRCSEQEEFLKELCTTQTYRLKPEVREWLDKNVPDRDIREECPKGWAVSGDRGNSSCIDFNIFFHRKKDALNFIKKWGKYPKPETDFNYFTSRRMKLDTRNMKMKVVELFE